jgi:hypothetical protein
MLQVVACRILMVETWQDMHVETSLRPGPSQQEEGGNDAGWMARWAGGQPCERVTSDK